MLVVVFVVVGVVSELAYWAAATKALHGDEVAEAKLLC